MGASKWTNDATYAAIANAPSSAWRNEARGEVWLHEWLHGVCAHFAQRGHVMPERDADGGELHGYVRSPTAGWTEYYRDLMNGNVLGRGKALRHSEQRMGVSRIPRAEDRKGNPPVRLGLLRVLCGLCVRVFWKAAKVLRLNNPAGAASDESIQEAVG
jgi:hypothetical protein